MTNTGVLYTWPMGTDLKVWQCWTDNFSILINWIGGMHFEMVAIEKWMYLHRRRFTSEVICYVLWNWNIFTCKNVL